MCTYCFVMAVPFSSMTIYIYTCILHEICTAWPGGRKPRRLQCGGEILPELFCGLRTVCKIESCSVVLYPPYINYIVMYIYIYILEFSGGQIITYVFKL